MFVCMYIYMRHFGSWDFSYMRHFIHEMSHGLKCFVYQIHIWKYLIMSHTWNVSYMKIWDILVHETFHIRTKTFLEPSGYRTRQPGRTWLLGPVACSGTNQNAPFLRHNGTNWPKSGHGVETPPPRSFWCGMRRGGGLGSRPKKMYGERLGDGVEYHLMSPSPRR